MDCRKLKKLIIFLEYFMDVKYMEEIIFEFGDDLNGERDV